MKCFGFSYTDSGKGLSIELCDEVIQYQTERAKGIELVGNIIVKSTNDEPKYLGLWHRADVHPFKVDETEKWLQPEDLYTYLFFNMAKDRGHATGGRTIEAKLFQQEEDGKPFLASEYTSAITVPPVGDASEELHVSHPIRDELERLQLPLPAPEFIPYTYAEIGPFTGRERRYAIRVSAKIGGPTFRRLVTEVACTRTRFYEIYGANEIMQKIEHLDLPELKRKRMLEAYNVYGERFACGLQQKKLTPMFYSIVAIDSPDSANCTPSRIYTIHLRRGLEDLTHQIPEELCDGHESLKALQGRIFWFVNRAQSEDFKLQLDGPMAKTD